MGYLLHILIALGALALAQAVPIPGRPLVPGVALLCAFPHLLGQAARLLSVRGHSRRAGWVNLFLALSPPALYLVALLCFGWSETLVGWGLAPADMLAWPRLSILAHLAPFVVYQLLAIDARARLTQASAVGIREARSFQARMFLSGLAPLVIYLGLVAAAGSWPALRVNIEEVALWNGLFTAGLLLSLVVLLPFLLCGAWSTVPIEAGWQRSLLEAVARSADFRCRKLLVWRTGGRVLNAAIVGLTPRSRMVLFTDALLAVLGPRELAAVFAHEIGHARRRHVLVFGCFVLGSFLSLDLALQHIGPQEELTALLLFAGFLLGFYLAFGYMSRRFELDADLVSLEVTGDPEALARALDQVGGMHSRARRSWRHFGTADRVEFIRSAALDPAVGRRLRRVLRRFVWLSVLLFAVGLALQGRSLVGSFERDRMAVDLRFGRYAEAARRLERAGSAEIDLAPLVTEGARLAGPDGELEREQLEQSIREALAGGELELALIRLELGYRRGFEDCDGALLSVEVAREGDLEGALSILEKRAPGWREALEAYVLELAREASGT